MTGLLVACLVAAAIALGYGISSNQPGLITDSLSLTAFALLVQVVRRGLYLRGNQSTKSKVKKTLITTDEPVAKASEIEDATTVAPIASPSPAVVPAPAPVPSPPPPVVVQRPAPPKLARDDVNNVVAGYQTLSTTDVVKLLSSLTLEQLTMIEVYERTHDSRKKILARIEQLRRKNALSG